MIILLIYPLNHPKSKMVLFDSSDSKKKGGIVAVDEELASLPCSCLSPKSWKKGGGDNELSDIVMSFDEKYNGEEELRDEGVEAVVEVDAVAVERNAASAAPVEPEEEEEEEIEAEETTEQEKAETTDGAADSDVSVSSTHTEEAEVTQEAQDGDDGEEKDNEAEVPVAEKAAAAVTPAEEEEKGEEVADELEELEMPSDEDDAGGESLLKLSKKTKLHKPTPKSERKTHKKALFDEIPDDESEASIEVLFRYMGCTQEAYGERYQNPTISATMTMDTIYTMHTTGTFETIEEDNNDLIENIETIATDDNDDTNLVSDTNETTDDNDDDLLRSPSGNLLMGVDENDNTEPNDRQELFANKVTTLADEQLDDATPADEENDDATPAEEDDGNTSADEQPDTTPADEQVDGTDEQSLAAEENATEEQTSFTEAQPVFSRLTVDTKAAASGIPPPIDSESAVADRIVSEMSALAKSPSVRKLATALLPKYPTTDYTVATECSEQGNTDHSGTASAEEKNTKEVNTECALAEEEGEKIALTTTSKASESLSKVEEIDDLIKSTRAWLHTQKVVTAKTKNTRITSLPEMKKLDTSSLPEIDVKDPLSTRTPSSSAQPLSPRTLDSLLLSRKTTQSDGPKKSILEQLEEIRAKQRERVASPRSS